MPLPARLDHVGDGPSAAVVEGDREDLILHMKAPTQQNAMGPLTLSHIPGP